MFTKTPVSLLLIIWMVGIILFFNMFLGPFTEQLQTVKDINMQINNLSLQNQNKSIIVDENTDEQLLDYTPLAVFNNFLNSNSK